MADFKQLNRRPLFKHLRQEKFPMPKDDNATKENVMGTPVYFAHLLEMLTVFRSEYERCPPSSQGIRDELMNALMDAADAATYYAEESEI